MCQSEEDGDVGRDAESGVRCGDEAVQCNWAFYSMFLLAINGQWFSNVHFAFRVEHQ
jgi:hypothetical protein